MLRSSLEQEKKLVKLVRHDIKTKQGWSKEGFQVRIEEEDRLLALSLNTRLLGLHKHSIT